MGCHPLHHDQRTDQGGFVWSHPHQGCTFLYYWPMSLTISPPSLLPTRAGRSEDTTARKSPRLPPRLTQELAERRHRNAEFFERLTKTWVALLVARPCATDHCLCIFSTHNCLPFLFVMFLLCLPPKPRARIEALVEAPT